MSQDLTKTPEEVIDDLITASNPDFGGLAGLDGYTLGASDVSRYNSTLSLEKEGTLPDGSAKTFSKTVYYNRLNLGELYSKHADPDAAPIAVEGTETLADLVEALNDAINVDDIIVALTAADFRAGPLSFPAAGQTGYVTLFANSESLVWIGQVALPVEMA